MVLEAQFQIATAALLGGLTNVVVLSAGTSGIDVTYPADITGLTHHQLQHEIEAGANWNAVVEVTRRHVALVAKLARTLAATPEVGASGSMLDPTAILFMSDNAGWPGPEPPRSPTSSTPWGTRSGIARSTTSGWRSARASSPDRSANCTADVMESHGKTWPT
ncbi:DUF1552 domain-containing protein [Corallococcus sp. AB045]|uniref:DUF1552 domain-containing protein n=1 Tax=Corallococcus sp. AB045 TaxID=2316719 RepID=UPI001F1E97E9|nr:DUF1552 domain-containing protein [Corallococcus sp. AB045]